MRVRVIPGSRVEGEATVPGDKSISHRWLLLAATALGASRIVGLPRSLDVMSSASCLAQLAPAARAALEAWTVEPWAGDETHGSTWNRGASTLKGTTLEVHGEARGALREPAEALGCGNSGTTMRLVAGLVAAAPFETMLVGDESLSLRPMERVARPLRAMGAGVDTVEGHPPLRVRGSELRGIRFEAEVPSAQVKGAVLLAGMAARGATTVVEGVATRDHTERSLAALGAPIRSEGLEITLEHSYQHDAFEGRVPGDVSSAAFLVGAAALTGGTLTLRDIGLNPSRLHVAQVLRRMGLALQTQVGSEEMGEPLGEMHVPPVAGLEGVRVSPDELPLVVDEVPVLASLAAHGSGESRFEGAGELRLKESDRLAMLAGSIRDLGGEAAVERDVLVIGGGGLSGGTAEARGDHRMAMALVVAALGAEGPSEIEGIGSAEVSFPGFVDTLRSLGANLEGPM
jgi:3-phosphoshikimate 1-carboxyvinyltransferase